MVMTMQLGIDSFAAAVSDPASGLILSPVERMQHLLDSGAVAAPNVSALQTQIFNSRLDAAVCALFLVLVSIILIDSLRVWWGILSGSRSARVEETPFVLTQLRAEEL